MTKFLKPALLGAALVVGIGLSSSAQALTITSIKITSGLNDFIQIGEFQAFANGTNVAALANGGTTSTIIVPGFGTNANQAIDGIISTVYPAIYHSGGQVGDAWTVTFNGAYDVTTLNIYGRSDGGVNDRDLYTYTAFNGATEVATGALDARNANFFATASLPGAPVNPGIPEPATWAMMISGFGLVGGAMRLKQVGQVLSRA